MIKSNLLNKSSTKKLIMAHIESALDGVIEQHSFDNEHHHSTCYAIKVDLTALCQNDKEDFTITSIPFINVPGASRMIKTKISC